MTPNRIWTLAAVLGGSMVLAASTGFPGILRGLPLEILVMLLAVIGLALTHGPRGSDPDPIHKEGREDERG